MLTSEIKKKTKTNHFQLLDIMNKSNTNVNNVRCKKVDDILTYLAGGFLRGTIRCSKVDVADHVERLTAMQCDIRTGITYVCTSE
jgi:hypothetical protein